MRFVTRTLWGFMIAAACAAVLWYGVQDYRDALAEAAKEAPKRPAPERIYTVRDIVLEPTSLEPVTRAYGRVEARRVLELRAAIPGRIVDIDRNFSDGTLVDRGAVLIRIDPATTESREADLLAALADARSRERDAAQAARLAEAELDTALRQQNLRQQAYQRQKQLFERGVASRAAVENAQLALGSDQQAVISRRQGLTAANSRVEQAQLAIQRAEIALGDARRDVVDADVMAPFAGVLDETSATLGRLTTVNETLGRLVDLGSLEVAFRLTDSQFARVLNEDGRIRSLRAETILRLGERTISTRAVLERAAAKAEAEGGRTVYASLETGNDTPLRPGDFVEIRLTEPTLSNVAEIPARAATEDGRILLIGDDNRLTETRTKILRRLEDTIVIADAPFGARIVAELRPQLGPGIKVQNAAEAAEAAAKAREAKARRFGGGGGGRPSGDGGKGRPDQKRDGGKPKDAAKPSADAPTPASGAPASKAAGS